MALAIINLLTFYIHPIREAIVPEYHQRLTEDKYSATIIFSKAVNLILILTFIGILADFIFRDQLADLVVGSSQVATNKNVSWLLILLAPAVLLLAFSEILNGILTCYDRVILQAAVRFVGALSTLLCLLMLASLWQIQALVTAYIVGLAVTASFQVVILFRLGIRFQLIRSINLGKKFWHVAAALFGSYLLAQLYVIFEKNTLSYFTGGLVSAIQYSTALVNILISIIALTMSNLLWPRYLKHVSQNDHESVHLITLKACKFLLKLLTFLCLFCFIEAEQIIRLLFARGAFGIDSIQQTTLAFKAAIFATLPIAVTSVVVRILVTRRDAHALVWIGSVMALSGILTLFIARTINSELLALSHWLIGNTIGVVVTMFFFEKMYSSAPGSIYRAVIWLIQLGAVAFITWFLWVVFDLGNLNNQVPVLQLAANFALFSVIFIVLGFLLHILRPVDYKKFLALLSDGRN